MIEFRPIEPVVLTPEEAATYLRLDEGRSMERALIALTRLASRHQIRPVLYRNFRLYRRAELDRFLESCQPLE